MAATKKKPPRRVFEIHPHGDAWKLTLRGSTIECVYPTQKAAITQAQKRRKKYPRSQILVFGEDGKVRTEWTYGDDPVRTKG
jgi:hypothetical protein